jgi:hypothetical protein
VTINTFATLKTAIANWLERTDLTDRIPEFIALAQAKMYRGQMGQDGRTWIIPPLRVRDMIATADIAVTSGVGALPTGWLEFLRLWIDSTDQPNLKYLPPQTFYDNAGAHNTAGAASLLAYTLEGSTIRTAAPTTETLKSVHYAAFTAMSGDGDADWLLLNAPNVYLDGALAEAYGGFIRDAEAAAYHALNFSAAIKGLNAQYSQAQHAGSALQMRPQAIV